jgi:lysophospholipase L1-like esterase
MVELARYNKIKVILTSCLPAKSFGWRPSIEGAMDKIRHLNARVQAYAKANKIPYVDYFSAMVSADGTGMNQDYTPETVHPNDKGYEVMESLIVPAIEKIR